MWICNKNNQLINVASVKRFDIVKGKDYYNDDAVLKTYYYICADGIKIIKTAEKDEAFIEFDNIKHFLISNETIYNAGGLVMSEDEQGNLID